MHSSGTPSGPPLTVRAHAKINLGLRVLRKRPDGYHDIETIFHRVDISDEITISTAPVLTLACSYPDLPTNAKNLSFRAAELLQNEPGLFGFPRVSISLKKRIPVGAGLGGGSSDAASTLLGIVDYLHLPVPHIRLCALAASLGSDVPYFLSHGSAHATGRGEQLKPISISVPYWILVVFPGIHVSTQWAYEALHRSVTPEPGPDDAEPLDTLLNKFLEDPVRHSLLIRNDFEQVVFAEHPRIAALKQVLLDGGALFAQMSGSGSSVYGFYANERDARRCIDNLGAGNESFLTPPGFRP
jgi:4-diphosphocytidyl-2-C-methyl-D-erythritol kinase